MPYYTDGMLTTDKQEIGDTYTWDTQTEWAAYQSKSQVEVSNGVVKLAQKSTIDDFEDNDLAEYAGDTATWATQTSTVSSGSYAAKCTVSSGGGDHSIASTSGLPYYPSPGDTFRAAVQIGDATTGIPMVGYFAQSETATPDGYKVLFDAANSNFKLRLTQGGSNSVLVSDTSVDYTGFDTAFWAVEVDVTSDNTHTVTLLDDTGTQVSQISTTDTTFTSGGICLNLYQFSGSNSFITDHIRVTA